MCTYFNRNVDTMRITNLLRHDVQFRFYYTNRTNPFAQSVPSYAADDDAAYRFNKQHYILRCGETAIVKRPPNLGVGWERRLLVAFDPHGAGRINDFPTVIYDLDKTLESATNVFSRDNICRKRVRSYRVTCNNDISLLVAELPECADPWWITYRDTPLAPACLALAQQNSSDRTQELLEFKPRGKLAGKR